jgi:sugar lactone lactonase YvrE
MAATLVLGQNSMSAPFGCNLGGTAPAAATLCSPTGASFDWKGNLWVSDTGNSRVLEFVPPFSSGMAASLELGQPMATAFTSKVVDNGGITASSLWSPWPLAFDSSGDLWLADVSTNRVLEFVPPFSNGMAASTVLGQANFTLMGPNRGGGLLNPAANTFNTPNGLGFDSSGNLNVADSENNRILIFAPPFTNGMNATTALGQESLIGGGPNQNQPEPTANSLHFPLGVVAF